MNDMSPLPLFVICAMVVVAALSRTVAAAQAHTFTVNSALDELGTQVGSGVCETAPGNGVCTLRRAFAEAQAIADRVPSAPSDIVIWLDIPGGVLQLAPNASPMTLNGAPRTAYELRLAIVGVGKERTPPSGQDSSTPRWR